MMRRTLFAAFSVCFLAACVKEPVAYQIEGGDHSLTLERNKPYFWSSGWELDLIVARYPECQRRYALKKVKSEKLRVDLYSPEPFVFILNQGKNWYVAETRQCRMQAYEEPPAEPGPLLGSFRTKGGQFAFYPADDKKPLSNNNE
ncbi:MAG: hypothetical protein N2441_05885 [Rhodocyclaceae bacterium]|nr:hypothetical protein [Rhodocyclaceae bacterium]